ncbi:MAG: ABC transporter ATP-binding protein [Alcanivorax sp.]|nr:ABC transporter ATP-binding protein [Alcanivorax sp.]
MSRGEVMHSPDDTPEPVIHCRGLKKSFGTGKARVPALNGLDLDVHAGELLMLVGPSGCGKTTFLSVLSSLMQADTGSCRVLGRDILAMPAAQQTGFRRDALGFVFQAFNLIEALSAVENVAVPLRIAGTARKIALQRAAAMLEDVGISRLHGLPGSMSGGQQQRIAIARALVTMPSLILCDEPTSNLDHDNGQKVMALLRARARAQGSTVVLVTHDARIFHYADRLVTMEDGRLTGAPENEGGSPLL